MSRKKKYVCKVCGKEYEGYRKGGTCSEACGLEYFERCVIQLREKEGEIYEKWKMRMKEMAQSL